MDAHANHRAEPDATVKVKGSTKRQKPLTILTMEQFIALVRELRQPGLVKQVLPMPQDLIIFLVGNLGPRVSKVFAFKWSDIDEAESTITIQRVFTHSRLKPYPTPDKSWRVLPLHPTLLQRRGSNRENIDEGK